MINSSQIKTMKKVNSLILINFGFFLEILKNKVEKKYNE